MIISKNNEKIKFLKKLKVDKKFTFLDNPKIILEAIDAGYELKYLIFDTQCKFSKNFPRNVVQNCEIIELNHSLFDIFADTCNSQGVIGVVKNLKKQLALPQKNFLILDNLQDPGNVGTLLRTALGADFKDVYLLDCVNLTNDKLLRSSMGAVFKLNAFECSKNEFLEFCKKFPDNFDIFVGQMQGENVFNIETKKQFGIILGNEANGVSKEMQKLANKSVAIPMANNLESLNVGVAGAILMYELNKNNL